jgi:Ca2+-binding EF-hand superfamily protein
MVESTQDYTIPFQYKKVFTPEECTELVQNFKNYDANKDGHICLKEFTKILKDMGRSDITAEMQEDVFKKYDRNTNDVIEYLEFLDMFVCFKTEASTFGKTEG